MSKYVYVMQSTLNTLQTSGVDVFEDFSKARKNMIGKAERVERYLSEELSCVIHVRVTGDSHIMLSNEATGEQLARFTITKKAML